MVPRNSKIYKRLLVDLSTSGTLVLPVHAGTIFTRQQETVNLWASLTFFWGSHLQTTLNIGYYIGFRVEFTTGHFFSTPFF